VVVEVDPGVPVVDVDTVEEWATVSDATSSPSPTAPAVATAAMAVVTRRTLVMARSRATAWRRRYWLGEFEGAMG
jgi:hypothetical protein